MTNQTNTNKKLSSYTLEELQRKLDNVVKRVGTHYVTTADGRQVPGASRREIARLQAAIEAAKAKTK